MNYNSKVAELLKEYRIKSNLTQEDIAKKMGVTKQTVSNYELGLRTVSFEYGEAFCKAINIDLQEFVSKL